MFIYFGVFTLKTVPIQEIPELRYEQKTNRGTTRTFTNSLAIIN